MKAIKYIFSALVGMAALVSCDSNITDFEYQGYTGAPKLLMLLLLHPRLFQVPSV